MSIYVWSSDLMSQYIGPFETEEAAQLHIHRLEHEFGYGGFGIGNEVRVDPDLTNEGVITPEEDIAQFQESGAGYQRDEYEEAAFARTWRESVERIIAFNRVIDLHMNF